MKGLFTQLPGGRWLLWSGAEGKLSNLTFDQKINDPLIGPRDILEQFLNNPHKYPGVPVLYGPVAFCKTSDGLCYHLRWHTIEVAVECGSRHPHRRHFATNRDVKAHVTITPVKEFKPRDHQIKQLHTSPLDANIETAHQLVKRARRLIGAKPGKYNDPTKG